MSQVSSVNSSNPKNSNFLIIGQGDIGLKVTNTLAKEQKQVTGLARSERQSYDLNEHAHFLQADALKLTAEQIQGFTHIAIIVAPNNYDAENYKNTYLGVAQHIAELQSQLPQVTRVVFISSTGVYGQDAGQWIDETVEPQPPKREASQYILQAEQVLQQAYGERAVIIRPSGIYGEQRLMRVRKSKEQHKEPMPLYDWTNRIMDTDLVNIIVQVLLLEDSESLKPIYLATDYAPVTSFELTTWLADQLNSTAPTADSDTNGSDFSGKRLHSNIPCDWLQFPDWQSGYSHILQSK